MIWIDNMLFMAQIETITHLRYIQTGAGTPHVVPQLPICTERPLRPPPNIHSPSYEAVWVVSLSRYWNRARFETPTFQLLNCLLFLLSCCKLNSGCVVIWIINQVQQCFNGLVVPHLDLMFFFFSAGLFLSQYGLPVNHLVDTGGETRRTVILLFGHYDLT